MVGLYSYGLYIYDAYVAMAYIVMAHISSYGLYSYGLYSHGLVFPKKISLALDSIQKPVAEIGFYFCQISALEIPPNPTNPHVIP